MEPSYIKKVVEYTFKNSSSEKVQTIILNQYNFNLQAAGKEIILPYANVHSVRLSKNNAKIFKITIYSESHRPIIITNKYYLPDGQWEDRSRQYTAFVRVLHYHLKDKSSTVYTSGFSLNLLTAWLLISAFTSFFVSFISEYLGISLMNPFVQALLLTAMITIFIVAVNRGRLPRTYPPEDIPFQFLP
jgi:hypothetical protein